MNRQDYLLAEMRCASLRARLVQADIEAVGIALRAGVISAEQALHLLSDVDALSYIEPQEVPDARSNS